MPLTVKLHRPLAAAALPARIVKVCTLLEPCGHVNTLFDSVTDIGHANVNTTAYSVLLSGVRLMG